MSRPAFPPQLAVAGAVALIAVLAAWGMSPSLRGFATPTTTLTEPRSSDAPAAIPAAAVSQPLVETFAGPRTRNPFNLREVMQRREASIPPPPPPRLQLPQLPLLPVTPGGSQP